MITIYKDIWTNKRVNSKIQSYNSEVFKIVIIKKYKIKS